MPYLLCEHKKQNTFWVCWLWSVSVLFRFVFEEGLGKAVLPCQAKPCFHLELDPEAQAPANIRKKKKNIGVCHWWDPGKSGFRTCMAVWVAIEPKNKGILALTTSRERNMLVAERFIQGLVKAHGRHPVSTGGGTWYPQACRFPKLKRHLHSPFEKGIIERTMQYIKDRTECFDDYFPCRLKNCKLKHVKNWLRFFVDYHNSELIASKWTEPKYCSQDIS